MNGGSNLTQAGACAVGHTNPGFNQQFPGSDDGKNRTVLRLKTMVSAVPSSHHPIIHCPLSSAQSRLRFANGSKWGTHKLRGKTPWMIYWVQFD